MRMVMLVVMSVIVGVIMAAAAIIAMHMVVAMSLVLVRLMVVTMVVIVSVIMVMPVVMSPVMIGPAFRMEGCLDLGNFGAKTLQHVSDDVIATDADVAGGNLAFQVAIAQMIGDACRMQRILAAHLEQFLGSGHDLDQAAVLQHIAVAAPQEGRLGKIDEEFKASDGLDHAAPTAAFLMIKDDRVCDGCVEMACFGGADHDGVSVVSG